MAPTSRVLSTLIVACCLAACALPNAAKRTGSGATAEGVVRTTQLGKKVSLPASPPPGPDQPAVNGGGLISNNGGSIISDNGSSLSGFVHCPPALIGNNGAGIISDNGLGLISNNGGSYRVLADGDVALKGATVALLDAGGVSVKGADGQPLTAKTDDQGHYVFKGVTPANNLILAVSLGSKGQLSAIAPKTGDAQRKSDLDVISTLTTRYILSQYVKGQSEPQKVLDKLPADVETDTRKKAAAAFAAAGLQAKDLQDTSIKDLVTQLRQKDTTFDAQMETVKKLLVAAGLSDLGNGQKATDVLLNAITEVVPGSDGSTYFYDGVLWRVTPQGMLTRLTVPGPADATLQGRPAAECKVGLIKQLAIDNKDRLWFLTDAREPKLWRIETDGTLNEMGRGIAPLYLFTPTGDDGFLALQSPTSWGQPVPLYQGTGATGATLLHTFTGTDASIAFQFQQLARDGQGRLLAAGLVDVIPKSYRFDLTTKTLTKYKAAMVDGVGTVALDATGVIFYDEMTTHVVHMITPDGTDTVVSGLTHLPFVQGGVTRTADGNIVIKGAKYESSLYLVKAGTETLYAGKEAQTAQTGGSATATALKAPTGLAVAADGTLYVTDAGALLRFHATEGTSTLVAADQLKDGATTIVPARPRLSADGWVYFIGQTSTFLSSGVPFQGVWRVKPGSAAERVYTPADRHVQDFMLNADGSMVLSETTPAGLSGTQDRVTQRSATGTVTTLIADDQNFINSMDLARDAQGRLLMLGARKYPQTNTYDFYRIFRYNADASIELLPVDTLFPEARNEGQEAGGYYYADPAVPKAIRLYTPATNKIETLTGPGNRFFSGTGVDDGVIKPVQPRFDGQGNLYFLDPDNKQVKRIPGAEL